MKREDVIKGLEWLARFLDARQTDAPALRAAIALLTLTPPTMAEIEAAREWLERQGFNAQMGGLEITESRPHKRTLDRALDALARESDMAAELAAYRGALSSTDIRFVEEHAARSARIAALEARLARVRELIDHPRLGGVRDEHTVTIGELRAALAADAGPEVSHD